MPSGVLRNGTHYQGPLLGRDDASGGAFENVPIGFVDRIRSRYKCFLENFDTPVATAAILADTGVTITDINTATSPTSVITSTAGYLLMNPGTKADSGSEYQWKATSATPTYTTPTRAFSMLGPITSTTTLMDAREILFSTRVGFSSNATTWDGKVLIGWFTDDTSLMTNTTGVPSVATGGGVGFHIGELGALTYLASQTAITAAGTSTGINIVTLAAANTFYWYDLAFRVRWLDASDGTGTADFYVNQRKVGSITTDLPMASTQVYAVTYAIQNGPAQLSDMAVEYVFTAITRPGHTNTSTAGT